MEREKGLRGLEVVDDDAIQEKPREREESW